MGSYAKSLETLLYRRYLNSLKQAGGEKKKRKEKREGGKKWIDSRIDRIIQKIRKKPEYTGEGKREIKDIWGGEKNGIIESVQNSTNILCS